MPLDRRLLVGLGLGVGGMTLAGTGAEAAGPRRGDSASSGAGAADATGATANRAGVGTDAPRRAADKAGATDLVPDSGRDVSRALQAAIDRAAERRLPLVLAPGRYLVRNIRLRPGSVIDGQDGCAVLSLAGDGPLLVGDGVDGARLTGLALDGNGARPAAAGGICAGLVALARSRRVTVERLVVGPSAANGIVLAGVGGRVVDCAVTNAAEAGIYSLDATGLEIAHNEVSDCANNGILVWRTSPGEDGTIVARNRIARIAAKAGGTGQNGNGVAVFRAAGVLVTANRITDCAYTAVRGNQASNLHIVANSCQRLGEVALYAEFAFEGAIISANLVDDAATGISVTNFDEGGRLAVVEGNIVRNLRRRDHEPVDKRGEGIAVEADTVVTGNVVENAPTAGISIGWGRYMREVVVTSNVVRCARVGIQITRDPAAGAALVANNMISGAREGAIRAMELGELVGPDLAKAGTSSARITIAGNATVG
jgi:uncharacterized secreted repeat protein (TIGR03808 family)